MQSSIPNHQGFALLLTLMVVSVVLSIGLTLLNITIKQLTLSVTGRESEIAFHIAGAMLECTLLHRQRPSTASEFEDGTGPDMLCGTVTSSDTDIGNDTAVANGRVYHHDYQFNYSSGRGACGEVSMYVLDASADTGDVTTTFSGEGLADATCASGNTCTVAFARGFNRDCGNLSSLRTVQREFSVRF